MSERIPCEFCLIRYVPDVVKGEFTNIGVVLREVPEANSGFSSQAASQAESQAASHDAQRDSKVLASSKRPRNAVTQVRFTSDWRRVRCIDPDADIDLLEALEEEIASRLLSEATAATPSRSLMELLTDTLSNAIQITAPRPCLAESFALEMEQLLRLYIEPIRVKVSRERTGRTAIHAEMRRQFELAGAWAAMFKRYPVAEYTRTGDPMRLDCGYRPNGTVHIYHAISLANDADIAKGLAFTMPVLRAGLKRKNDFELDLAAVVEPLRSLSPEKGHEKDFSDEAAELYKFGVEIMEGAGIRVLTTKDLPRAADTVRRDLRL